MEVSRQARVALSLFAGALAIRLWGLGNESLWGDETFTWNAARLAPSAIWAQAEQTPPLYNLLMHVWVQMAGESETALRLPSALFGAACVAALYLLGLRTLGPRAAFLGSLLLALAWMPLRYSQIARAYPLFALATTLSFLFLLQAHRSGWRRWRAAYLVATVAMLYSHAYGLFFLAAQGVAFLLWHRPSRLPAGLRSRGWRFGPALAALALVLFAPWFHTLLARTRAVLGGFWIPPVGLKTLGDAGMAFVGYAPAHWDWKVTALAATTAAGAGLAWWAWERLVARQATSARPPAAASALAPALAPALGPAGPASASPASSGALPGRLVGPLDDGRILLWCAATVAVALALAVSVAAGPVFVAWYVLPAWGFAHLLVAAASTRLPGRLARLAAVTLVGVVAFQAAGLHLQPQAQDWRGLAQTLEDEAAPGALVVNTFGYCDSGRADDDNCTIEYYQRRDDLRFHPFIDSYYRPLAAEDIQALNDRLQGEAEVWAVYSDLDSSAKVTGPLLQEVLNARYSRSESWEFHRLRLEHHWAP